MFEILLNILQKDILQNDILITLYDYLACEIRSNLIAILGKNVETPNPEDEIDRIQKKYSKIASTYPFQNMIAMIKAFDPGFDIIPYIKTVKTDNEKINTMNQLLILINKSTTDKWIENLDLLYKNISGEEQTENIKRMEEIGELKIAIFTFRSVLNKIFLKHLLPNSPLLKLL
jgi:hypothetical protein